MGTNMMCGCANYPYELEANAALKQQFANITAHDCYKMLDYVQREAYQAQKRHEHEVQQATYDLAQHLETLNQYLNTD